LEKDDGFSRASPAQKRPD